ncbi:MAG: L-lysine 6-transaminase [Anaerolineales bacterium]|nr:L-lysine 6-transaminase [Anaerolineales bacterium]
MKPSEVHATIKKYMIGDGHPIVVDLEKSHGAYIIDGVTGREYIDFFTYFASIPIGHNHPKMREPEFLEKLTLAAINKPSSSDMYTTFMAEFVETFARVAMPDEMQHLFLISGGALAVENALKTAFDWKVRKNMQKLGNTNGTIPDMLVEGLGTKIIHFEEAFHGRSGYTLSLTNTADPRKYMYFPKFNWPRIVTPKLHFPVTDQGIEAVKQVEEIAIAQIESAVKQYPGDIAALIIEPIQGEGGDNHFRPEFFRELRRLADEHEFLFIVDEIQSGMGITGKMWAIDQYGVQPDVIAFGKKAQVCGIIAGPRIDEVKGHVFEESSRINSTWGGNLVDMVRATRYLEIIAEENLLEHTTKMGKHLLSGLNAVAEDTNGLVSNVRGSGMMVAFDMPTAVTRDEMLDTMKQNGLYALKCGQQGIRFRGMLDVPQDVIDKAVEIVDVSVQKTAVKVG